MHNHLITLNESLYLDAFALDDRGNVIFLSAWGRDGAMQQLFASLTLPLSQGGIREQWIKQPDGESCCLGFGRMDELKKLTTRLPRYTSVGEWVHTWLMLPELTRTPYGRNDAWLLSQSPLNWRALWPTVKYLCHLPLLDCWEDALATVLSPMVTTLSAWGVHGCRINLVPELVEPLIADAIQSGLLPVSGMAWGDNA